MVFHDDQSRLVSDGSVSENPDESASPSKPAYRVYKRRWFILTLFTAANLFTNVLWNDWPPIQETCRWVFWWTDRSVLVIGILNSIGSLLALMPAAWIIKHQGLRFSALFSIGLLVLSLVTLVISCGIGQCKLSAIYITTFTVSFVSAGIQMVALLRLSAIWFPPTERTTATAICIQISYLGTAASYIIGPNIIPDVGSYKHGHKIDIINLRNHTSPERMNYLKDKIEEFLYILLGVATFLFLCFAVYFPAKPPTAPSASAVSKRLNILAGLKNLVRNKNLLILVLVYSISCGVQWGWVYVMDLILSGVGIDQKTAGWIGFAMRCFVFPGIAISRCTDRFKSYTKPIIITLYVASATFQVVYSLTCEQVIPLNKYILFAMAICQFMCFSGTTPIVLELAAECAYPVDEGLVTAVIYISAFLVNFLFYLVFTFLPTNPLWMNWVLVAAYAVCIPLVFIYQGKRRRLEIDMGCSDCASDASVTQPVNASPNFQSL